MLKAITEHTLSKLTENEPQAGPSGISKLKQAAARALENVVTQFGEMMTPKNTPAKNLNTPGSAANWSLPNSVQKTPANRVLAFPRLPNFSPEGNTSPNIEPMQVERANESLPSGPVSSAPFPLSQGTPFKGFDEESAQTAIARKRRRALHLAKIEEEEAERDRKFANLEAATAEHGFREAEIYGRFVIINNIIFSDTFFKYSFHVCIIDVSTIHRPLSATYNLNSKGYKTFPSKMSFPPREKSLQPSKAMHHSQLSILFNQWHQPVFKRNKFKAVMQRLELTMQNWLKLPL